MKSIHVLAPAKLNLTLDILGVRPDGYHALDMLMQTVSVYDELTVTQGCGWGLSCRNDTGEAISDVPCDSRNLAWRAAECFFRAAGIAGSAQIDVVKRIPSQAGMAGGSADAAAVLRALNELNGDPFSVEELCKLSEQCGSDVPFCVLGGTARVGGRGEVLCAEPTGTVQHYAIVKPPFGISTPRLFALSDQSPVSRHPDADAMLRALRADDPEAAGALLCNVLEEVALREHPEIEDIRRALLDAGACGARMTGSGSAVFGIFRSEAEAKAANETLKSSKYSVFYAHSV